MKRLSRLTCTLALLLFPLIGAHDPAAVQAAPAAARKPVKILVAYYSRTGSTEEMARAVVEGVCRVPEAMVLLKRAADVTRQDLEAADGIILGSPTYFANIPGEMKTIMDQWNWKWKVDFTDKIGGAFATAGGRTGGQEHVVVSLLMFMLHNRMLVAGPLYQNETTGSIWAESGATAVTGPLDTGISEAERQAARRLGERIADLAAKIHPARVQ
ncbi:MAG TPA: flavodoxin family protein [Anaerohalosphaeraceae bacterium]|nr:flavodoxin family protein [Anaerohalosphaeraceae bacterium]HRT51630.1 flavodoxin family protein [Anaerohalosphaeraceae bacterium]HRT87339.1 flavodoxin family protein [Anaerohalosphaeraceae bacterium]